MDLDLCDENVVGEGILEDTVAYDSIVTNTSFEMREHLINIEVK